MIRSMTAYGRNQEMTTVANYSIEIHSVNRRNLDINIFLPKELLFLDTGLRKWLANHVKRGAVVVRIHRELDPKHLQHTMPEFETLRMLHDQWKKMINALDLDSKQLTLPFLVEQYQKQTSAVEKVDEKKVEEEIYRAFDKALEQFIAMKKTEGSSLLIDIEKHLTEVKKYIEKIQNASKDVLENHHQKLLDRFKEIKKQVSDDDREKIYREIIIYAERIDITEEITRIFSHLSQFEEHLKSSEISVGKNLDFLLQELMRETNTINSKSTDTQISNDALLAKSTLEKIREQVQNIE